MVLADVLSSLTVLLVAGTAGAMVFFSAIVAPTVFRTLPEAEAGRLIRALFPQFYGTFAVTTAMAALVATGNNVWRAALVLALVAGGFVYARQVLLPKINALRDAFQAGDEVAGRQFARLHRTSVLLVFAQLGLILWAFGILVVRLNA